MRVAIVGILINASLAIIKGVTGVLGNSYALIADAIESTLDIASSFIVWGGLKISTLPPDEDHPYGHGKAEPLAAIIVSISLFVGAITIAVQSINEILLPHHAPAPFTLFVLVGVIIVKEVLFRFVIKVGNSVNSTSVKGDAMHHRSDALTSLAAFIGISIALIGGKGYEEADDWAAMVCAVIISINAFRIFKPAINEIMDAAPQPEIEQKVRKVAGNVKGVLWLEKCYIRKMGLEYFVDLHVTVDAMITVHDGHEIATLVKQSICASIPQIADVLVHIEPSTIAEVGNLKREGK